MSRLLIVIQDSFLIGGRGLTLAPGIVPLEGECYNAGQPLVLKRPDGTKIQSAIGETQLITPNPNRWIVITLYGLSKDDVPIGTEVWSTTS